MTTVAEQPDMTQALSRPEPAAVPGPASILPEPTVDYTGASLLQIDQEASEKLAAAFPNDAMDIKPTGEVYVSQVHYRRRLNQVFGPGQWALVPKGKWTVESNTMMREYVLLVRGHFIAEAVGECDYQPNNERMSWADAAEGCKSNALTRTCKDLGIASECWDRIFAERWRDEHCMQVWVDGQKRPQWRRLDALPFYKETGPTKEWAETHGGKPGRPTQPLREPGEDDEAVLTSDGAVVPGSGQHAAKAGAKPNPTYPIADERATPPSGPARTNGAALPACPKCGKTVSVMKSKYAKTPEETYYCNKKNSKQAGCGNTWGD